MRLIIPLLSCIIIFTSAEAQKVNYFRIRESVKLFSCTSVDSVIIFESIKKLEAVDTIRIGRNLQIYYEDIAVCYGLAAKESNDHFRQKAIAANKAALFHNPKSSRAL